MNILPKELKTFSADIGKYFLYLDIAPRDKVLWGRHYPKPECTLINVLALDYWPALGDDPHQAIELVIGPLKFGVCWSV